MLYDEENQRIDQFTAALIRRKAWQLVGLTGLTAQDRADIEQTLLAWIQEREPNFDTNRAHWNQFVVRLVDYGIANLLRERRAQKRGPHTVPSLEALLGQAGESGLGTTDSDNQQDARLGRRRRTDQELAQLKTDMAGAIERLPSDLRSLAELLMSMNISQAAKKMGIPRTTANDWVRRIRMRFENAGLEDYLKIFPSPRR